MRLRIAWPVALLGALALGLAIAACGSEVQPSLEERAKSIDSSLICPVCPGETIDQAQVELAHQMRAIVREKLADGWSREQVQQFFVDRYGESVLAAPPKEGFNLVVWVVPLAVAAAAFVLLTFVIRAMRRGGTPPGERSAPPMPQELDPYLSLVDRELGFPSEGPQEPEKCA